ncbi:glucan biosynthesis protein [Immundisolibacter sp.]|uniref:glucan biosynthesis protein n=1 Tax=Immundisolibacter sp. TaxID=1934948 RepID=UPI003F84E5C3
MRLWALSCLVLAGAAQAADVGWPQAVEAARQRAEQPYQPTPVTLPDWLQQLDPQAWQEIRFDPSAALWAGQGLPFSVRFHHRGSIYRPAVEMREIAEGQTQPLRFAPAQFFYGPGVDRQRVPGDLGYAGFTVYARRGDSWVPALECLGGSFLRAGMPLRPGGARARALAIDAGLPSGEEFPAFTDFWLVRPAPDARTFTAYALLDSPRVSGAYRIELTAGTSAVTSIEARLFFRDAVGKIGLGPLSSMFWHGEIGPRVDDYRPEVHSSDGLLITTRERRLWRPLGNPPRYALHTVPVPQSVAYGLLQRDRDFAHYQDLDVAYHEQPDVLLEPEQGFDAGRLELLELPVEDPYNQNVLAYVVPERDVNAGDSLHLRYRLRWGVALAAPGDGQVQATRIWPPPDTAPTSTYQVDFGPLGGGGAAPRPLVKVDGGTLETKALQPFGDGWRLALTVRRRDDRPLTLQATLVSDGSRRSETWIYRVAGP